MTKLKRYELYRRAQLAVHVGDYTVSVKAKTDIDVKYEDVITAVLQDMLDSKTVVFEFADATLPRVMKDAQEEAKQAVLDLMTPEEVRAWADELTVREVMES